MQSKVIKIYDHEKILKNLENFTEKFCKELINIEKIFEPF